ncbi:MAG: hypothetical protein GXX79_13440, partial [Actinomycetales bacterium]|nr:hypothetical protein [Actinomycetales bacterium]
MTRYCAHGRDLRCNRVHADGDPMLGRPLCLDCYDHDHQVVFNVMSGELWRRTIDHAAKALKRLRVRASFAKVAEMQTRGVVHFHALIRLDHLDSDPDHPAPPPAGTDPEQLRAVLLEAAAHTAFTTPGHADKPDGWVITWGQQVDCRAVRADHDVTEVSERAVAAYLAKYATKSTEDTGHLSARITEATIGIHADPATHVGRLIAACWHLGRPGAQLELDAPERIAFARLRRWAHMLGFGGHFSTKSRRYSTTLGALRAARKAWRRRQTRPDHARRDEDLDGEDTTLLIGHLTYAGTGWHTTGDALLA